MPSGPKISLGEMRQILRGPPHNLLIHSCKPHEPVLIKRLVRWQQEVTFTQVLPDLNGAAVVDGKFNELQVAARAVASWPHPVRLLLRDVKIHLEIS